MSFDELCTNMGKFSQANYPLESCGIITKDFKFIPSKNLSSAPKVSFLIDPVLLVEYDDNIWGIFHSHPDENFKEPSEEDLKLTLYEDLKFILGNNNDFFIYWYDSETKIKRFEKFNENHCKNN